MAAGVPAQGFPRRHRFEGRGSFGAPLRSSRKARGELAVIHAGTGRPGASRLGIALTKRFVALSTDRNRVKRLVREAFRRHALKGAGLDCVVTLRRKWLRSDQPALESEIKRLFDQLAA